MVAAKDHQKVGDHSGLAFLVQLDQAAFAQTGQGHFNGTDGAFNDHVAGVDDGGGLLALEHGGGDLRGVGQVSDAGF